jgi:hypothetical protein
MASPNTRRIHPRILDAIFLAGLCVYVFLGLPRVPFHGDESTLIRLRRTSFFVHGLLRSRFALSGQPAPVGSQS